MKKNKKLYIIPGFGESTDSKRYKEKIINKIETLGLEVVSVKVDWDLDSIDTAIQQVDKQIPKDSTGYILGFSFGAYIAAVLSPKKKLRGYFFCSLSPYFKEDLLHVPQKWKDELGKKMVMSLGQYSFPSQSKASAWFIYGDKEGKVLSDRAGSAYAVWKGKKELITIKGVNHNLTSPKYSSAINELVKVALF